MTSPFWPDHSPHFLRCRQAVRPFRHQKIVIGYSGGADSLALVAAARAEDIDAHAVCIDHGLQAGSTKQAHTAIALAENLGVPATVIPVVVAPGNVEAQARQARYAALHEYAAKYDRHLWVAHTANDQLETLLLTLLRGHLAPMAREGQITRPFLHVQRRDTEGACRELGLAYWDDPMNQDQQYLRVKIRSHVIPLLQDLASQDVIATAAQAGQLLADEQQALAALTVPTTDIAQLQAMPKALRTLSIRQQLLEYNATINATILQAIEQQISNWHGQGEVNAGTVGVRRKGTELLFRPL